MVYFLAFQSEGMVICTVHVPLFFISLPYYALVTKLQRLAHVCFHPVAALDDHEYLITGSTLPCRFRFRSIKAQKLMLTSCQMRSLIYLRTKMNFSEVQIVARRRESYVILVTNTKGSETRIQSSTTCLVTAVLITVNLLGMAFPNWITPSSVQLAF